MNLKELSKLLGLSQTTVSRALNGFPEVNDDTRRRVMEAAEHYNYRPNTRAQGLATGRSRTIGHVIPLSTRTEMVNPVFADFIAGAGEMYSKRGYDMTLSVVKDEEEKAAYRDWASKGSVDGVIVHGPRLKDPRIELLLGLGLPFVVHGRSMEIEADYSWMDVNNRRAFKRATEFLIDLGHQRIGFLNGDEIMSFAKRRRIGYEDALTARDLPLDPTLMRTGEMMETYGHDAAIEMICSDNPPTAFLVSSMLVAVGVRRAVQELGLKLGRDISLVTHDDDLSYLRNSGEVPMFTATQSSVRQAGQRCGEMLLNMIEAGDKIITSDLWEAQLLVGESTGPARPRLTRTKSAV